MKRRLSINLRKRLVITLILSLLLTFASLIYQNKPIIMDAEIIYFGFPFAWLVAGRGTFGGYTPWTYDIRLLDFLGDFAIYSLLITVVLYLSYNKKEIITD